MLNLMAVGCKPRPALIDFKNRSGLYHCQNWYDIMNIYYKGKSYAHSLSP